MNNNRYVEKKTTVTAYPDRVEPGWNQAQQPYVYRTNSQTDPVSEAYGFVLKYSLWAILSGVISIGLALRNNWDAGLLLVAWGIIATVGYIVIFLLLSLFTPEGVAVVHEWFDYLRYKVDAEVEMYRLNLRAQLLLAGSKEPPALPEPKQEMELTAFAWRADENFVESIEDDLYGVQSAPKQENNATTVLVDFLSDLYGNADKLLRDGEIVNLQAGVQLPWSKRSEVPAPTKAAIDDILKRVEPPLFFEYSGGRVVKLNTKQYPTAQDAIRALSV